MIYGCKLEPGDSHQTNIIKTSLVKNPLKNTFDNVAGTANVAVKGAFTKPIAEIPVGNAPRLAETVQANPGAGIIEVTKSGLLRDDQANLSLYYIDGSNKIYISPSPQIVANGGTAIWTGLDLGKTYYVEEDFHKIENIYTYDVANPVAEIPVANTTKEVRTVQNNPNLIVEMPVDNTAEEESTSQNTLEGETITGELVPGETYVIIHGSTIIKSSVINLDENTTTSDFAAWYILMTIKDKNTSPEAGYMSNPIIFGPATFNPIMTRVSFFLRDINSDGNKLPANTEIIKSHDFVEIDSMILIPSLSAIIGLIATLAASSRRRRYERWKHTAYGINKEFKQD